MLAKIERTGLEPVSLRDPEMSVGVGLTAVSASLASAAITSIRLGEVNHGLEFAKQSFSSAKMAYRFYERCMDMVLERQFARHEAFIATYDDVASR